jgi:hypothetical protein
MAGKTKGAFSTGMRRQREPAVQQLAASLDHIQAHTADLLTTALVPCFFLLPGFTATLSSKKEQKHRQIASDNWIQLDCA